MKAVGVFVLMCAVLSLTDGQFYSHLQNGIKATVTRILRDEDRAARSTGDSNPHELFKYIMVFKINLQDRGSFELILQRNDKQTPKVPVKLVSDDGVEMFNTDKPKDYRFYQVLGDDHGAAVMVKCPNFTEPCHIAGRFYYYGEEYLIDPETGLAEPASDIPHTVYNIQSTVTNYGDDTVKIKIHVPGESRSIEERLFSKLLSVLSGRGDFETRAVQRTYQVELEMVVADDIFKFFMDKFAQDKSAAVQKIVEYYEQVANGMDLRFSTVVTDKMKIDIVPALINIRQTPDQCKFLTSEILPVKNENGRETYNAENVLTKFSTWARTNMSPKSDAIMMFSRRDMWSEGKKSGEGTTGLADMFTDDNNNPISAMCRSDYVSASIVEDLFIGDTASTAAHELAHNMGVEHDDVLDQTSKYRGKCPATKLFIMAPSDGYPETIADAKNPWAFSSCSIGVMDMTHSTLPKTSDGLTCLEKSSYNVDEYNRILKSLRLGAIYSKDEQCEMVIGTGFKYCNNYALTQISEGELCYKGIPCSTQFTANTCSNYQGIVIHADDGTSCGLSKQCYRGVCVDKSQVPASDTGSIQAATTTTPKPSTTTSRPTTTTPRPTTTTPRPTTTTPRPTTTTPRPTTTTPRPTTTTPRPTTTTIRSTTTTESSDFTSTTGDFLDKFSLSDTLFLVEADEYCSSDCTCIVEYCSQEGQDALCQEFAPECYE